MHVTFALTWIPGLGPGLANEPGRTYLQRATEYEVERVRAPSDQASQIQCTVDYVEDDGSTQACPPQQQLSDKGVDQQRALLGQNGEDGTIVVHLTDRKQAEARLRGCGNEGAYTIRAKTQQEITSGTVAMTYLTKDSIVIHHKFVAQADGTFTIDGKRGAWTSLAEAVSSAKTQAGKKRGLTQMTAIAPGDGVVGIKLLPGTRVGQGLVSKADHVGGAGNAHARPPQQQQFSAPEYATPDELIAPGDREYDAVTTDQIQSAEQAIASRAGAEGGMRTFAASGTGLTRRLSLYDGFSDHDV